ncbi:MULTISPECIES: TetR/AcrR family transcriptional regulator [unclassified Streptomyces]|uniref:TetR/AcrR family transcriptional regulator n=1 Tax=unclassified Streptomyces TaxID=2593676 RepID=UPI002E303274|nr:TetR/AcrR family transcriptional regulator [Streptomyces sp. NBC_01280]
MTSQEQAGTSVTTSRRSKITPEREREFYDAVLDQLRENGYEALTMEGVAAQACCSKSTLYRQWKTKPQLVAAALRAGRCVKFASVDTGTLTGDLRSAARAAAQQAGRDTQLVQALGHAVLSDEELQGALREALVEPELAALGEMIDRAVARGEIAADHPALEFLAAQLLGVQRIRPVLEGRYADADYLTRFVDAVVLPALGLGEAT